MDNNIINNILIAALLLLILGCIIKSQKLKSKFLRVIPLLIIGIFFILLIPVLYVHKCVSINESFNLL